MPKTCARCDSLAGRGREVELPGAWVEYLRSERGLAAPVGTLSMPLCTDCYPAVERLREAGDDADAAERSDLLEEVTLSALVDGGA